MKQLSFFVVVATMESFANSAELTCNIDPGSGACYITNITEISQHNEPITVVGQPSNYINTATTLAYFMENFVIRYIPTKIFSIFPNVESFMFYNSSLTYMVTDSFANCASLKMINIVRANVKNLPAGVAQTCINLNSFGMTEGLLETIDPEAFRGLSNMHSLFLSNNKISCISGALFQLTPNLGSIDLSNNMITGLDSMVLKGLKALNYFNLHNNQIQSLPQLDISDVGIFNGLQIAVHDNPITAINPNFLSFFPNRPKNITDYINFISIPCVQDQTFIQVTTSDYQTAGSKLQTCYDNWQPSMATPPACSQVATTLAPTSLATTVAPQTPGTCASDKICRYFLDQYNRYTCILDGVDSLLTSIGGSHLITFDDLAVRRVVFTNSFLSRIPPILFQKFPNLEYLTASNSSMSSLNTKTFGATCGNLKFFDASYNDITSVDGATFKSCTKIEVVDLSGNQFSFIDGLLFINNLTLKNIYINRPPSMVLM